MDLRAGLAVLVACAGALTAHAALMPGTEPEDQLKAATVLAFLQYSQWPDSSSSTNAITVGVLGRPAFAQMLRRNLDGKPVGGRPIRVVEISPVADPRCCQAIYLATDKKAEIQPVIANARSAAALLIGETDRFLDYGGGVNLYLVDGHMGFEVNLEALERAGIVISSKLLRFGQVHDAARERAPR